MLSLPRGDGEVAMKTKKPDWADKKAASIEGEYGISIGDCSRALRAAERRGFKRVVKLLRMMAVGPDTNWQNWADWLEERERK